MTCMFVGGNLCLALFIKYTLDMLSADVGGMEDQDKREHKRTFVRRPRIGQKTTAAC